jgi:predicted enzyme involved in methoxymalonyl-ACP biosynthesis
MSRYIVLTENCTCGHRHRFYDRAINCLDKFEDNGIPAKIVETSHNFDPLFIDKHLLKGRLGMRRIAEILQTA